MKIALKDLKANPYKKHINGGILNPSKINLLEESINKDGFWDNIICRRSNGHYEIAYGHHRVEAAKNVLGKNHEVDVPCKPLTEEAMVRILGSENCMQNEEYAIYQVDQVLLAKKFLEENSVHAADAVKKQGHWQGIGCREISEFLGEKNWGKSKVHEYLKLHERLNPKILHKIKHEANTGGNYTNEVNVTKARAIARIPDHKKQWEVYKLIKENRLDSRATEDVVSKQLKRKVKEHPPRVVNTDKVERVMSGLDGQEVVFTSRSLEKLINKLNVARYGSKELALIRVSLKGLDKAIQQFLKKEVIDV